MTENLDSYHGLVRLVRGGGRIDRPTLTAILKNSGKTAENLLSDAIVDVARGVQPGDRCECGGYIVIAHSRRSGGYRSQYMKCPACGKRHGKRIVPAGAVRPRMNNRPK